MRILEITKNLFALRLKIWELISNQYHFPYWSTLVTTILCMVPVLFGWDFDYGNHNKSSAPLVEALSSNYLTYALIAGIAVSVPISSDILLDSTFTSNKDKRMQYIQYSFYVSSCPSLILLAIISNTCSPEFIPIVFLTLRVCIVHFCLFWMNKCGADYWTKRRISFLGFLISVHGILDCYTAFLGRPTRLLIIQTCIGALFMICFFLLVSMWCYHIYISNRENRTNRSIKEELLRCCCHIQLVTVMLLMSGILALQVSFGIVTWAETSSLYLSLLVYLHSGFIISTIVLLRVLRYATIRDKETLTIRRMFMKYVSCNIQDPLHKLHNQLRDLYVELSASDDVAWGTTDTLLEMKAECAKSIAVIDGLIVYDNFENAVNNSTSCDLNTWSFIRDTVRPYLHKAYSIGYVSFEFHVDPEVILDLDCCSIFGDKLMIINAIRNLIDNAIKFSPVGGKVTVTATLMCKQVTEAVDANLVDDTHDGKKTGKLCASRKSLDSEVDTGFDKEADKEKSLKKVFSRGIPTMKFFLKIDVTDSGAGLDEEQRTRLFRNIGNFPKGADMMAGLGLWLTGSIIEMHKGQLTVSSPGVAQGCTFSITLPISKRYRRDTDIDILGLGLGIGGSRGSGKYVDDSADGAIGTAADGKAPSGSVDRDEERELAVAVSTHSRNRFSVGGDVAIGWCSKEALDSQQQSNPVRVSVSAPEPPSRRTTDSRRGRRSGSGGGGGGGGGGGDRSGGRGDGEDSIVNPRLSHKPPPAAPVELSSRSLSGPAVRTHMLSSKPTRRSSPSFRRSYAVVHTAPVPAELPFNTSMGQQQPIFATHQHRLDRLSPGVFTGDGKEQEEEEADKSQHSFRAIGGHLHHGLGFGYGQGYGQGQFQGHANVMKRRLEKNTLIEKIKRDGVQFDWHDVEAAFDDDKMPAMQLASMTSLPSMSTPSIAVATATAAAAGVTCTEALSTVIHINTNPVQSRSPDASNGANIGSNVPVSRQHGLCSRADEALDGEVAAFSSPVKSTRREPGDRDSAAGNVQVLTLPGAQVRCNSTDLDSQLKAFDDMV